MKRFSYPFLLAIYPVLFLYSRNRDETRLAVLIPALVASLILCALLWGAARILLGDTGRASLATAAALGLFFGYGHACAAIAVRVTHWTRSANPAEYEGQIQWALAFVCLVILTLALLAIKRASLQTLGAWSRGLTVCAVVLLTLTVATALRGPAGTKAARTHDSDPDLAPAPIRSDSPDIYQIVLDGYARRDVLARHYQFDNGPFLEALSEQGFEIAERSNANFNWTFLSLGSMLNMEYVTDFERDPGRYATDRGRAHEMLRNNRVARFLKHRGYTTIHFDSTWEGTLENTFADVEVSCDRGWFQNNFYRALAESSMLRMWGSWITNDIAICHQAQMLALEHIAPRPGPKFVFAHFIPPHHPYLFDRQGAILRRATVADQFQFNLGLWARRDLYRDQLFYMNGRMLRIVREIMSRSERPPIIILHSDHGPQLLDSTGQLEADNTRARLANLLAVRTPGVTQLLPDDVTLVNVYRILLNHYFDAGLPILPAKHYFSPFEHPYAFEPVPPEALKQ